MRKWFCFAFSTPSAGGQNVQISLCKKLTNKYYHVQAMPKRLQLNSYPKARWKDVTNTKHWNCYKRTKHILSEFGLKCWKWHWKSVNPRWCKITNIRDHKNILIYLIHKILSALRNESKKRQSRLSVYLQDWSNLGDNYWTVRLQYYHNYSCLSMCMRFKGKALNIYTVHLSVHFA